MKTIRNAIALMMSVLLAAALFAGCAVINVKPGSQKVADLKKTTVERFDSICVDVEVADVDIIPEADAFAIEYHMIDQDVTFSVKDGVLTLKAEGGDTVSVNFNQRSYVRIYVPEGSEFAAIDFKSDVGNFRVESAKVDDMTISTDVGNAVLTDVAVNRSLTVETSVGNVDASLANTDCSYHISGDVAKILINGTDCSGLEVEKDAVSPDGPQVHITTSTGSITLNWKS